MHRKPVTIHYRKLDDASFLNGTSFDRAVCDVMQRSNGNGTKLVDDYRLRVLNVGDDNYLVNLFSDGEDYAFGDIVHFTPGHLQALLASEAEVAPSAKVEQMPAPSKKEYIHSLMYWMIRGEHVFVIQSQSLKAETVEKYFTWLLSKDAGILPANKGIILANRFDPETVGGDLSDIREVIVGGSWKQKEDGDKEKKYPQRIKAERLSVQEEVEEKSITKNLFSNWDRLPGILEALLGAADVKKIMDSIPKDAQLKVDVHIGYKTRKKVSREALRNLEVGLRHLPESQLTVIGKDGKKAPDGKVMLKHTANIKLVEVGNDRRPGSLLDPTDVLRAMNEAYRTFRDNGKFDE